MTPNVRTTLESHFGPPISVYTDADALADDELIDISSLWITFQRRPVTRMTKHLWADFEPFLITERPLLTAAGVTSPTPMQQLAKILRTKVRLASRRGGIWKVPPGLWLVENDHGGWSILYPEDY